MAWRAVDEALPEPEEVVYRYGPGVLLVTGHTFPSSIDRGKLVTAEGERYADWGVTHWMRVPAVARTPRSAGMEAWVCPWCGARILLPEPWWTHSVVGAPHVHCPTCHQPCAFDEVWDEEAQDDVPVLQRYP